VAQQDVSAHGFAVLLLRLVLLTLRTTACSPALAAFDAEHDADAKALLENPFLADLGSLMRPTLASARVSSTSGAGAAAAAAAGAAANNAALADIDDLLGDDALFADLLTNAAVNTNAAVSTNDDDDDALLASVALLGDGVRQSVPQIDGGTGTSLAGTASTASTASTSAAASGTSTVAASRLDSTVIGSDDDDDEILGATAAAEVRDYIVCLYDDVKRAKTKRKLSLLDGVASVQGVDYVFRKGAGECDFQSN
jgi:hypothetical protein